MGKAASRIISVIINIFLFFTSVCFMFISIAITDYWERYPIYIPEFIMCIAFIVIAFSIPFGANFLLYRFWYKKAGMSRLWIIIPLVVTYLTAGLLLFVFVFFSPEWWNSFTWHAEPAFALLYFCEHYKTMFC